MVSICTYTFGHVYYGLLTPLHIYTLVIILNLFYFRFIYSILYILHTLIFKNKSSHFASQYRITQRYHLSSLEPSPLRNYCASPRIELLGLALVHIHSHSRSSNQIHSPTSDIPFTLTHPHSSYTPWTSEGSTLLSHILDHLFYGVLFGLIQTL